MNTDDEAKTFAEAVNSSTRKIYPSKKKVRTTLVDFCTPLVRWEKRFALTVCEALAEKMPLMAVLVPALAEKVPSMAVFSSAGFWEKFAQTP
ncbi:hypothetical protein L9W76_03820 [Vibrio aestuarianus]|uniref:hypothetical protein n=1 Tax=Vibrio aestuarianus TaxID=28171 RepID=UPI0021C34D43|nr:hypothetical protein [Vibrio aestuarianus]MDE1252313.1 hypothetical protein [Vibrio aestuarianus]